MVKDRIGHPLVKGALAISLLCLTAASGLSLADEGQLRSDTALLARDDSAADMPHAATHRAIDWNDPDCKRVPVWLKDSYPACRPSSGVLGSITFDDASTTLTVQAQRELESIAATLRQNASMQVVLTPKTFAGAVRKIDRLIATGRAEAVQLHLRRLGISTARLRVAPVEEPLARETDPSTHDYGLTTGLVGISITTYDG